MPSHRSVVPIAAMLASLAFVAACDNSGGAEATQILPAGAVELNLAAKPAVLFQVFGDASAPLIMPLATVSEGRIQPIGLTRAGWREFDSTYFASGTKYRVYQGEHARGTATVTRGMWATHDTALYALPGCRDVRPLGVVTLDILQRASEPTVEFLAMSFRSQPRATGSRPFPSSATIAALGRHHGLALGIANQLEKEELDSLDFIARMIRTGTRPDPTLLVSFIGQQAGDVAPGVGHTSHLLALFDKIDTGYVSTYRHVKSGEAKSVEFQRVLDHLDVDGDGVDELILESWHYAGNNELVVLGFKAGQWHEVLRASSKWCLDPP